MIVALRTSISINDSLLATLATFGDEKMDGIQAGPDSKDPKSWAACRHHFFPAEENSLGKRINIQPAPGDLHVTLSQTFAKLLLREKSHYLT